MRRRGFLAGLFALPAAAKALAEAPVPAPKPADVYQVELDRLGDELGIKRGAATLISIGEAWSINDIDGASLLVLTDRMK